MWEIIETFFSEGSGIAIFGGFVSGAILTSIPFVLTSRKETKNSKKKNYKELSRLKVIYHQNLSNVLGLTGQANSFGWALKREFNEELRKELIETIGKQSQATHDAIETKALINAEIAESKLLYKFQPNETKIATDIEQWTHINAYNNINKHFDDNKGKPSADTANPCNPRDFIEDITELLDNYLEIIRVKL